MFDLDGLWNVQAVKMTSIKTQLPFEYYSIPICKPDNLQYKPENLGRADFLHFFILYLDHSAKFCYVQLKKLIFMIHYIVYLFDGKHGKKGPLEFTSYLKHCKLLFCGNFEANENKF